MKVISLVGLAGLVSGSLSLPALAGEPVGSLSSRDAELLADAAGRASFSQESGGGWDKGAFYISDGGANKLSPYGFIQYRYNMNFRDKASAGNQGDFTEGFQMRRARMGFKGTIWDKNLSYDILAEFNRGTGTFGLLDAYGNYKWDNGVSVRWGQFKAPLLREELVSDTKQLAVERSTVNGVFTQGRSQLVQLGYETGQFRGWFALSDGLNTLNTDFTAASEADFGLTARAELRWGDGDFKRFDDMVSWRGSKYAGLFGAAIHYQDGGETGGTADTAVIEGTLDASLEGNGWNAFIEGVWRNTDTGGSSTDDFGVVAQVGYLVTDQIEPFIRYDAVFADDANGDDFHTLTAGMNYYISPQSHAVKFSADVQYYFDNEGASAIVSPSTGSNLLADTEDGQIAIRFNMLVMF